MRLTVEHGVVAAGVLLACASATFAAHKIATNDGVPSLPAILPAGELMAWKKGLPHRLFSNAGLDPTETGSLPRTAERPRERAGRIDPREEGVAIDADPPPYTLVEVGEEGALVEGGGRVRRVRVGSVLPGVGRVAAIVRIDGAWLVVTSAAVIRPSP